jgi:hypothetical protein
MVARRWMDNIEYYDYLPTTIGYDPELDAFTVARADIHTPDRRHRLVLMVVMTDRAMRAERISIEAGICRGRAMLEQLVREHRPLADQLTSTTSRVFDLSGPLLR